MHAQRNEGMRVRVEYVIHVSYPIMYIYGTL